MQVIITCTIAQYSISIQLNVILGAILNIKSTIQNHYDVQIKMYEIQFLKRSF